MVQWHAKASKFQIFILSKRKIDIFFKELGVVLRTMGLNPTFVILFMMEWVKFIYLIEVDFIYCSEEEVNDMINEVDGDGSGAIDFGKCQLHFKHG
jgi:hypothetical protein